LVENIIKVSTAYHFTGIELTEEYLI